MTWRIVHVIVLNFKKVAKLRVKHNPIFVKMLYSVTQEKTGKKYTEVVASGIMGDLSSLCLFPSEFPNISTKTCLTFIMKKFDGTFLKKVKLLSRLGIGSSRLGGRGLVCLDGVWRSDQLHIQTDLPSVTLFSVPLLNLAPEAPVQKGQTLGISHSRSPHCPQPTPQQWEMEKGSTYDEDSCNGDGRVHENCRGSTEGV